MTTWRIAWRNLGRNRKRTLLALGAIALAQTTLVFVNGFMAGSYDQMLQTITGPLIGHVQVHHPQWREEHALEQSIDGWDKLRAQLTALPGVASAAPRVYAPVLAASGEQRAQPADAEAAMILGLDPVAESAPGGILALLPAAALPQGDTVALGRILANRLHVDAGQRLALIGQDRDGFPINDLFVVGAILDSPVDLVQSRGVLLAIDRAAAFLALPDQTHEIVIRGNAIGEAEALARRVAGMPALAGMEVLSWRQAAPEFSRMIEMKDLFDLIFLLIVFVAAAAGIANTAMMSTFERTREFGMLLAIGMRPGRVVRLVLSESLLLGLLGVCLGSLLGSALVWATARTGIDYAALAGAEATDMAYGGLRISYTVHPRFEARHVLFGCLAVTLTSVLAAAWPALLAARLEPARAMRP
ncbi:MAG: hypothetical protein BWK76_04110 [Desulfobulbaceae bacterium A2]|nr:MAG: hypothetical protein BWK76_04110 [Desulfobulbaceae bacterium A2]